MQRFVLLSVFLILLLNSRPALAQERAQTVAEGISRAIPYVSQNVTGFTDPVSIMVLYCLDQHYQRDLQLPPVAKLKRTRPEMAEKYFRLYGKYFDDKAQVGGITPERLREIRGNLERTEYRLVWSMYCHQQPLPDNFLRYTEPAANAQGKVLMMAAIEVQNLIDNNCYEVVPPRLLEIRQDLVENLTEMVRTGYATNFREDPLAMAGIPLLVYMDEAERIRPEWVIAVLNAQHESGAWGYKGKPDPAITTFALWGLLAYDDKQ